MIFVSRKLGSLSLFVLLVDAPVRAADAQAVFGAGSQVPSSRRTGAVIGRIAEGERVGFGVESWGREPAECLEVAPRDAAGWTERHAFTTGVNEHGTRPAGAWPCRGRRASTGQGRWTRQACPAACGYLPGVTRHIQQQQQPFYGPLSGTSRVSRYQKKHSPTHHPDHYPIFISFFHLPQSIASSLFKLCACQSFCTTSFHVLFGLPLHLEPSTSYSIHFFTQSVSSFYNICPYHRNLFCYSINIISSIPILSFNSLLGTLSFVLTLHIHLTICARWSATSFSFLVFNSSHDPRNLQ